MHFIFNIFVTSKTPYTVSIFPNYKIGFKYRSMNYSAYKTFLMSAQKPLPGIYWKLLKFGNCLKVEKDDDKSLIT